MPYFSSLLFAVSASLDAFIVGITYGIRRIHIPLLHNLLISLITLAGTLLSICLGRSLSPLLAGGMAEIAGSAILIGMGAFYLLKFLILTLREYRQAPNHYAAACSCPPGQYAKASDDTVPQPFPCFQTRRELLLMGLALSANNMGIGIGASIAGIPLLSACICTFFCSVCFLMLGNLLGKAKLLQLAGRYSEPLSGLLLIGLGIYELL